MRRPRGHAKPGTGPHLRCWLEGPPVQQPDGTWLDARGHAICGAKSKRNPSGRCHSNRRCKNGRCRMHFGHARAGIASPSFKHGRYSLVLPRGMLQDYAAARSDPHWLSLRDELALTDARIVALIRRVEGGGDAATVLAAARQAYASYRAASNARDVQKMGQALTRLGGALAGTGAAPDLVTSETLTTLTELRKRLGEAQARMLKDLHQMLSLERVLAIMDHLSALVREHVPDPVQRRGIQEGLTRLLVAPKTDEER